MKKKFIYVKISKKRLPNYMNSFIGKFTAKYMNSEWGSFGEMAKVVTGYIEKYRGQLMGSLDLGAKMKYTVYDDEIVVHNLSGRQNFLRISLAEAPKFHNDKEE